MAQKFWIFIKADWKTNKYQVVHEAVSEREERFTVIARNKTLVFSSNRPLFRNKGLKHLKPDYNLIQGSINNRSYQDLIVEAIDIVVNKH